MKIDYPVGDTGSLSNKALMQLRQLLSNKTGSQHTLIKPAQTQYRHTIAIFIN